MKMFLCLALCLVYNMLPMHNYDVHLAQQAIIQETYQQKEYQEMYPLLQPQVHVYGTVEANQDLVVSDLESQNQILVMQRPDNNDSRLRRDCIGFALQGCFMMMSGVVVVVVMYYNFK